MENEHRKRAVLRYGESGAQFYAQDVPKMCHVRELGVNADELNIKDQVSVRRDA